MSISDFDLEIIDRLSNPIETRVTEAINIKQLAPHLNRKHEMPQQWVVISHSLSLYKNCEHIYSNTVTIWKGGRPAKRRGKHNLLYYITLKNKNSKQFINFWECVIIFSHNSWIWTSSRILLSIMYKYEWLSIWMTCMLYEPILVWLINILVTAKWGELRLIFLYLIEL